MNQKGIVSIVDGSLVGGDVEWLSICGGGDEGKKFLIHDTGKCPLGFLFKTQLRDLCVCGNGVWKLSSDVCGGSVLIDARDGDCFEIGGTQGIRWIRHLGHTHQPNKEFNFVTDESMAEIVEMREDGYTDAGYKILGSVNPRRSFSDCSNEVCYTLDKSGEGTEGGPVPRLLWAPIPPGGGMYATQECGTRGQGPTSPFPFGIPQRGVYYTHQTDNQGPLSVRHVPSDKCHKRCFPNFGNMSFDDGFWGDERIMKSHGVIDWSELSGPSNPPPTTPPPDTESTSDPLYPFQIHGPDTHGVHCQVHPPLDIPEKTKKDVGAQTERMVRAHYDGVILGKRAPLLNIPEFEYLRTGRLIFEKVCPSTQVPPELLKSLLVLFRVALNESLAKYPYVHLGDKEEDGRLKASLDACLAGAEKKKFKTTYNSTICPPKLTGYFLDHEPKPLPLDVNVPCEVDSGNFDYPIEAAWKLGMFTHYFCASHFNVTAFDHSRLEYKLRQLFNKEIITRWYHPGRSSPVFRHIFRAYDLDLLMSGIDRCVGGAKHLSPYPTWIKRPEFQGGIPNQLTKSHGKSQDQLISILKGAGRCLTHPSQVREMGNRNCTTHPKPPTCKGTNVNPLTGFQ